MARAIVQETQQLETDLNEERSRYQNLLTEHLRLEEKYDDLKEAMASSVSDTCTQSILILIILNASQLNLNAQSKCISSIIQYFSSSCLTKQNAQQELKSVVGSY